MRDQPPDPDDYDNAVLPASEPSSNTDRRQANVALQEGLLFDVMDDLQRGWLPEVDIETWDDYQAMRRLGYLAAVVAAFGRPSNKAALREMAAVMLRRSVQGYGGSFPIENAVPAGRVSTLAQLDALAERWGYHPGVDVDRWLFERG